MPAITRGKRGVDVRFAGVGATGNTRFGTAAPARVLLDSALVVGEVLSGVPWSKSCGVFFVWQAAP
ncbi:MAG: hypothetical protein ABGZ17_11695, partial [Planctomycetaceae bacterium]